MGFETVLGNDRLKENLTNSLAQGRISHFYLISGPAGSGKHTLARLLAAAILCKGKHAPCGACGPCRKVMENSHPDLITVEDPEHKTVAVKTVRQYREDVYILPNESDRKIYLFPQELGIEGQNTLLKILEEPPAYGVFILLSNNPESLLPTVRSRCTELALTALPEEVLIRELSGRFPETDADTVRAAAIRSGGYLGQAIDILTREDTTPPQTEEFFRSFGEKKPLELTKTLVSMEKWKRDQLVSVLENWTAVLTQALACRSGMQPVHPMAKTLAASRSSRELSAAIESLQKATAYAGRNVSVAAICGWLTWQLR